MSRFRISYRLVVSLGWAAVCLIADAAPAQTLPQGIGMFQYGYRRYTLDGTSYDASGQRAPIGDRFDRELDGPGLLSGDGGGDLLRLAQELDRLDPDAGSKRSLVDRLKLGRISADVAADVSAQYLGLAYGITSKVTVFGALPYVNAKTSADLRYAGENNAAALKAELGDLAYSELAAGLDEAARINIANVESAVAAYGYAPLGEWSKQGVGDAMLGARIGRKAAIARGIGLQQFVDLTLTAPTGYQDDPDILQDVGFGDGYWSTTASGNGKIAWRRRLGLGMAASYKKGLPAQVRRRVPESDSSGLVDANRSASVNLVPGDSTDAQAYVTSGYNILNVEAHRGLRRHFADHYSGGLDGDYDSLGAGSDKTQQYMTYGATIDTTQAYRRGNAAVPFILGLTWFETVAARNAVAERYVELSLTSFFATSRRD